MLSGVETVTNQPQTKQAATAAKLVIACHQQQEVEAEVVFMEQADRFRPRLADTILPRFSACREARGAVQTSVKPQPLLLGDDMIRILHRLRLACESSPGAGDVPFGGGA